MTTYLEIAFGISELLSIVLRLRLTRYCYPHRHMGAQLIGCYACAVLERVLEACIICFSGSGFARTRAVLEALTALSRSQYASCPPKPYNKVSRLGTRFALPSFPSFMCR